MEAVIKIGGSLAEYPDALRILCKSIGEMAEKHKFLVVPGGGEFADVVRRIDKRFSLSALASHEMAILGMDQFGLLLSELIPDAIAIDSLDEEIDCLQSKVVPVFLPSKMMFREEPLEASWDVTSDSIAAEVAYYLESRRLILAKDVDGLFSADPKKDHDARLIHRISVSALSRSPERNVVDPFLPQILMGKNIDCYIVNGLFPERIRKLLDCRETTCTLITTMPSDYNQ